MTAHKPSSLSLLALALLLVTINIKAQPAKSIIPLDNPVTESYLKKHLRKQQPRLVLNAKTDQQLKKALQQDPVVKNMYAAVKLNADNIFQEPLLKRIKIGRRLLSVSREMLYRMNMLGMAYHVSHAKKYLDRINDEVTAVCQFSDWNPSHYLDVAEMSMAVAIALDWTAGDLPAKTIDLATEALIHKGIEPSYNIKGNTGWVNGDNNWNQVCHGGMVAAALTIADKDPALAAKTIHRALEGIPNALAVYGPDGVYPEGSTYWSYGTAFTVLTSSMLQSALGTDFGISDYPAFMESATFKVLSIAPSGMYFNYADCGDRRSDNGDLILAWFAAKTGNRHFYEKDRFLQSPEKMGKLSRHAGAALVWLAQFRESDTLPLPTAWKGEGNNPIAIITGGASDEHQYYLGTKGGNGAVHHGNIDEGSFVFELDGVRWVVDPGNQSYNALEKTGFNLWSGCQTCERWTLLTKNNFGHSTLTINNALHDVNGKATISRFATGASPSVTIDLSPSLKDQLDAAHRTFVKDSPTSVLITDSIITNENTHLVTWQLITTADVQITGNGAILHHDGKQLKLENLSSPTVAVSVVSLDPPPLALDRRIEKLKRIELRYPAYLFDNGKGIIRVRLSGIYP